MQADLWSVGAILFQLVTGKTPYTGNNQIQLLDNIKKSTELQFPPEAKNLSPDCMDLCRKLLRCNPVERLTFEEFFNHPYLSQGQPQDTVRNKQSERPVDDFPFSERNPVDGSQEDCLPFSLDDDSSGLHSRPSLLRMSPMRSTYRFSLDLKSDKREVFSLSDKGDISNFNCPPRKTEIPGSSLGSRRLSEGNLKGSRKTLDFRQLNALPKDVDSFESIDQEYVLVPGPPTDLSSSARASMQGHLPSKSGSPSLNSVNMTSTPSAPVPIIGAATSRVGYTGGLESRSSASGTPQGSMDTGDTFEKPSTDFMTRIKSLQLCASAITDLVSEKIEAGKQLEAFSIQLLTLAIWKQALYICHTHAASTTEGSPIQKTIKFKEISKVRHSPDVLDCSDDINIHGPMDIHSQIERAFVHEVGYAEELAKVIEPGNMDLPDALELIYQSALALGKHAAVDEYMGYTESAVIFYSKAVCLLVFILVEAPCLILNPPFSLTNTERYRIQNYIDALINRENSLRSQRMALFKHEDQT
ncbi:serine threonine- kinase ATG1c-like isoform X1 [Olea europaea subsp. europaea]|uniref:Serine threonine- kinase ATG1c-like isoform X1 n=1 Tax=Olea europaea subsp. europaea TaxID=158383 RepID=A0A8S0RT52_OLEEU|nr:serine threonine- kinase ATG1c-like isoform X1 [Olea europaea subsp. europaea]